MSRSLIERVFSGHDSKGHHGGGGKGHHGGHHHHGGNEGGGGGSSGMLLDPNGEGINLSASGNFTGKPINEMQAKAYEK